MNKNFDRQMTSQLKAAVTDRRFLRQTGLSKKTVTDLLREEDWRGRLAPLEGRRDRLTCREIYAMAESTMDRLSPRPQEGWMLFCYRFLGDGLFPDAGFAPRREAHGPGAIFYAALMQTLFAWEREGMPFDWRIDLNPLTPQEAEGLESAEEYRRLLAQWRDSYIYEMMRLGGEVTPYQTLAHICGVHHLAVSLARDMAAAGQKVDVALVSGAAMTHDIGKYGCRPGERVPYLHYYYTDRWCRARDLYAIGHIAANHSTWDLEIELLPVESVLLITADFRVREQAGASGNAEMHMLDLAGAFDAILQRLDNVDDYKMTRYRFVYEKLRDVEENMRDLGVDVDLTGSAVPRPLPDAVLLERSELTRRLKMLSIGHNIALMHRLGSERRFGNILEAARSEKKWKNIRGYINIFEEYFPYLSVGQKLQTLSFLYELLMHREGDIRRQAAGLVGKIIAHFQAGYVKELPADYVPDPDLPTALSVWEGYLEQIILPDHKLSEQHKRWIGYTLKIIVTSLLSGCKAEERPDYMQALMVYFGRPEDVDETTAFILLDAMNSLPLDYCGDAELSLLCGFAVEAANTDSLELKVAALRVLRRTSEALTSSDSSLYRRLLVFAREFDAGGNITLAFLKSRLLRALGEGEEELPPPEGEDIISDIFLENLKTATPWITKAVNIKLLLDMVETGRAGRTGRADRLLHIAAHFSNLIKVSERVVVRHDAGAALLKIAPLLAPDQLNEIAVELTKGLEVGEYEFSKYIPEYLGQFALYLQPRELDELIESLDALLGGTNERIITVVLRTLGVITEHYPQYRDRFSQSAAYYRRRERKLLGALMKALASHQAAVRQEALMILGQGLFGEASALTAQEQARIYTIIYKKMLFLLGEMEEDELTFFYTASTLNHIYRLITAQNLLRGGFPYEKPGKVAFFPGTFDPFTLSHKGIVREIRNLGFEVMLAIDEFSWSKKTQPRLIRRQVAGMSTADMFHVYIFPDAIPVNIANPQDLARLEEAFPGREVYMVVGSDVVEGASSYQAPPEAHSIHTMNHVVFRRATTRSPGDSPGPGLGAITGKVIELKLPVHLEDISSTLIRDNIDANRDISHLIDPVAQEFIYHNSLYLREPQYKAVMGAGTIHFEQWSRPDPGRLRDLVHGLVTDFQAADAISAAVLDRGDNLIVMRSGRHADRIEGFISMRGISSTQLFAELGDMELADAIRRQSAGRMLLITGVWTVRHGVEDSAQLLLTEAIASALEQDCAFALFHPIHALLSPEHVTDTLERQGFVRAKTAPHALPLYMVDMNAPKVLIQNLESTIKEPLSSAQRVMSTVRRGHRRLQLALTRLYPGELVLSFSSEVIHQRLIDRIAAINGVPAVQTAPRQLGPCMCVPFGKILRGKAVPNTVTKTLHTDKVYSADLREFAIEAFPYYPPLDNQVRTINSFRRPVILVDNLLHGGDRMTALDPILREEGLDVRTVLVGILSGRGKDLMESRGRPVDAIYYVPTMGSWFVESTLYPFIGGDTVRRTSPPLSGMMPAVNMILPYAAPAMLAGCDRGAVFDFSLACIENARDIFLALETEYRSQFERNLTLNRLSEAVILPLYPDKGSCMRYDPTLAASVYLKNDIQMLMRTREMIIGS